MFQVHDRVRTLNALEGFAAGADGIVIDIDSVGNLIVDLVRDATGRELIPNQPLLPHGAANFEHR